MHHASGRSPTAHGVTQSRNIRLPGIQISNLEDPRLEPYRDIRNKNWVENSGLFIAEGPLLVRRLLHSDYACRSVLLDEKFVHHYASMVAPDVELLLIKHDLIERLVGFNFHRGVLACGLRQETRSVPEHFPEVDSLETAVAVVGVQDPENLGSIVRTSTALGVKHFIVGPGSADPLGRRALRVSMGTALRLRFYRSQNMLTDMDWLSAKRNIMSLATNLGREARSMASFHRSGPVLLLFGNERLGLPNEILTAADCQIRIDMQLEADSLNVSVAAGVLLHYVCRLA